MSNTSSSSSEDGSVVISAFTPGIWDELMEQTTAKSEEQVFENIVKDGIDNEESDAEIASKLVREFVKEPSFLQIKGEQGCIASSAVASGLDQEISKPSYWVRRFAEERTYTKVFWENQYRNGNVSNFIPEDPIHRFVLHFLRGWRKKLHAYIVDDKISMDERAAVLKKQVENFAFFSRKKPFGNLWKMHSEPNDLLRQALEAEGATVPAKDQNGNPLRTISNRLVKVQASTSIPRSAASSPTPDRDDIKIYDSIKTFATVVHQLPVHSTWTMVTTCFQKYNVKHRCYAFSGRPDSKKELHNMPAKWWEECGQEEYASDESQQIEITNVDCSKFGHYLVLILFDALKAFIVEDLKQLVQHVAFEEKDKAEAIILQSRRDMTVLNYGHFYDIVMGVVNKYDKKIEEAVSGKLQGDAKELLPYLHVSCDNRQFVPNEEKIEEILVRNNNLDELDSICGISRSILQDLQKTLNELPNKFLDQVFKQLQQSQCGEDNVIRKTLQKLLELNFECFLNVVVKFVAMDEKTRPGEAKPFCKVCGLKVPFYSVLVQLLCEIGSTGDDFDKLAELFKCIMSPPPPPAPSH